MSEESALVRTLTAPFSEVLERVPAALGKQGFGVLTTIDVRNTLKVRLGQDIAPYTILGACNPTMAHKALTLDPTIGVHLPCNVVVRELGPNSVEVRAVDPVRTIASSGSQNLVEVAAQVREMLARALAAL